MGTVVFDVCAAPGAKTTYIAQQMQNNGAIYSVDYSSRRLEAWKKETARMHTAIAQPLIADACATLPLNGNADLIVLDPPCTGTGIFAKQPSAKWRLRPKSIEKMAEIQWQMINRCGEKVAPGGVLIYSTCSITLEENEAIVRRFLKEHEEFSWQRLSQKSGCQVTRVNTMPKALPTHSPVQRLFYCQTSKKVGFSENASTGLCCLS